MFLHKKPYINEDSFSSITQRDKHEVIANAVPTDCLVLRDAVLQSLVIYR